jgi:predicted nucleotide-binding protein
MKRLSNADLRILYMRRKFLENFLQTVAVQMTSADSQTSEENQRRVNIVRNEIKSIVEDPKFDVLVSVAITGYIGYSPSPVGTQINVVKTARELLTYIDTLLELYLTPKRSELEETPTKTAKVFIGHGKNELVRSKVKDFIRDRCHLDPLVLHELPNVGTTVIEKLEKYGRTADYAVLILTADDITKDGEVRARQNVIQELGWFQGVLGRQRTAILLQEGVQIGSNISGVIYFQFQENNVEMVFESLRKEFEAANLLQN